MTQNDIEEKIKNIFNSMLVQLQSGQVNVDDYIDGVPLVEGYKTCFEDGLNELETQFPSMKDFVVEMKGEVNRIPYDRSPKFSLFVIDFSADQDIDEIRRIILFDDNHILGMTNELSNGYLIPAVYFDNSSVERMDIQIHSDTVMINMSENVKDSIIQVIKNIRNSIDPNATLTLNGEDLDA